MKPAKAKAIVASIATWFGFCLCVYGVAAFYEWSPTPSEWEGVTRGISASFMGVALYAGVFIAFGYISDAK